MVVEVVDLDTQIADQTTQGSSRPSRYSQNGLQGELLAGWSGALLSSVVRACALEPSQAER